MYFNKGEGVDERCVTRQRFSNSHWRISVIMASHETNKEWEDWQYRYLHGAFYIFPPAPITRAVDELRSRYDARSARYAPAHVSLSEPLNAPLSQTQRREISARLTRIQPFDIHYGPLRSSAPHPGVVFAITPQDPIKTLRAQFMQRLPSCISISPKSRSHPT